MPAITPIRPVANEVDIETLTSRITNALPAIRPELNANRTKAQQFLEENNAGIEHTAKKLAEIMHTSQREHLQLEAAKTILEIHDVISPKDTKDSSGGIQFIINSNEVNFQQLLVPQR